MLVAPSPNWPGGTSGIIIRNKAEMKAHLATLNFSNFRPQGLMIHNTASPTQRQWDATVSTDDPAADAIQRMKNMTGWYRDPQPPVKGAWLAGPHWFGAPTLAIALTPTNCRGTHSPNFNGTHLGWEMVGDFNADPFDVPPGSQVRDLTVELVAGVHEFFGWDPDKLLFHKDDPAGHQDCPGKNVKKGEMISRIRLSMAGGDRNGHVVDTVSVPPDAVDQARLRKALADIADKIKPNTPPDEAAHMIVQAGFNALGVVDVPLTIDGWPGSLTRAAARAYLNRISN